ncbi:MAG: hypothetical protein GXY48_10605 [Methanomicrobiales archaeon]|nr:hypothetical protein [Methanomicrobiales archaeon]
MNSIIEVILSRFHPSKNSGYFACILLVSLIITACPVYSFEIAPEVIDITPDTGHAGFSYLVTINGSHFELPLTAVLELDGSALNITNLTVLSDTSLKMRIKIPTDAKPGLYQLTLTCANEKTQKLNQAFHVQPPAPPVIENLHPEQAMAGSTLNVSLTGKYFRSGAFVTFSRENQEVNLTTESVKYDLISGICTLPVTVSPGMWNVTVTNPDGQSSDYPESFTVLPLLPPQILSITPDQGDLDKSVKVVITGKDFIPGASFSLIRKGLSISGTDVVVDSSGQMTGFILVPAKYLGGLWHLEVTNPDGQSVQKQNAFLSGTPAAPFSLHISPKWGIQGENCTVTIRGMAFLEGDRVALQNGRKTIEATDVVIVSDTQITSKLLIPSDADVGSWDVMVTSRYNKSDILRSGFSVYDKTSLILAGIEPEEGEQGQYLTATISGCNLVNGSTIALTATGQNSISGDRISFHSPENLGVVFYIPPDALPDLWDLTLTTPSGQQLTKEKAFRVNYNKTPVIMTIDPDRAPAGTNDLKVTVTGKNFGDGEYLDMNLSLNETDIMISGAVSYKGNRIIGYLTIPEKAQKGWYNLSVIRDTGLGPGSIKPEMFRVL